MGDLVANLLGLAQRDPAGAEQLFARLANTLPRSPDARRLCGQLHAQAGNFPRAVREYEAAEAIAPAAADLPCRLGAAWAEMGRYDLALAAYRRAMDARGGTFAASMAATMLHRLGRIQDALEVAHGALIRVARTDPERWGLLRLLTRLLRDGGAPLAAERMQQDLLIEHQSGGSELATWLLERDAMLAWRGWRTFESLRRVAQILRNYASEASGAIAFPDTFELPAERRDLDAYMAGSPKARFVLRSALGPTRTIGLMSDPSCLHPGQGVFVQRLVERPLLAGDRRTELRIFVAVTRHSPMRAYIYREGLAFFAPNGMKQDLNLLSSYATAADGYTSAPETPSEIRMLSEYLRDIGADAARRSQIWTRVRSLASHFLRCVAAEGLPERQNMHPPRSFATKLFALDITLDAAGQPWLMAYRDTWQRADRKELALHNALAKAVFQLTTFCVLDDRLTPDALAATLTDRTAFNQREGEIEQSLCAEFDPL